MRNTCLVFFILFLFFNSYFLFSVSKFELPKIDEEKIKKYSEDLGKAAGKGLAETVSQFLKAPKKKAEFPESVKVQQDFIINIFAGKKVIIPRSEINVVRTVKLNKAYFNTTALMAAVVGDRLEMVEYLLRNQADPNVQNKDGITALHLAARAGKKVIVKKLLAGGADPNIQDKHNMSPLMYAVMKNQNGDHFDVIKVLLHHEANPNLGSNKGMTSLMMAARNNDSETVKILLKHHAQLHQITFYFV
jgi:ankyrin repeat protein